MAVKNGVSLNWGGFDKALGKAAHKLGDTQALVELSLIHISEPTRH